MEVIQNTGSDLEHNEKLIVECVLILFQHTRPPPINLFELRKVS